MWYRTRLSSRRTEMTPLSYAMWLLEKLHCLNEAAYCTVTTPSEDGAQFATSMSASTLQRDQDRLILVLLLSR
jgi:hypothetical protein